MVKSDTPVWRFLNKLNIELLYDPALPLKKLYKNVHSITIQNNQKVAPFCGVEIQGNIIQS